MATSYFVDVWMCVCVLSEWPQVCLWSLADVYTTQLLCLCGLNFNWQSKTSNVLSCLSLSPSVAPAAISCLQPCALLLEKANCCKFCVMMFLEKCLDRGCSYCVGVIFVCVVESSSLYFIRSVTWYMAWCLWLFCEGREKDSVVLCSVCFAPSCMQKHRIWLGMH